MVEEGRPVPDFEPASEARGTDSIVSPREGRLATAVRQDVRVADTTIREVTR